MEKVLVIIPAYNEQESIISVIREIEKQNNQNYKLDYIVINDCSTDSTREILAREGSDYIDLPINLGIGGGMQAGYIYAMENGYDIALQIDGDGQHDATYINGLISPIISGECELTIGSRFLEKEGYLSSKMRRLGIKWLSCIIFCTCRIRVDDVTSGFRAAGRKVIELFAEDYAQDYPEPESIVMCAKKGFRIKEVSVRMRERRGGTSSISPLRSIYYMIKVTLAILFAAIIYKR